MQKLLFSCIILLFTIESYSQNSHYKDYKDSINKTSIHKAYVDSIVKSIKNDVTLLEVTDLIDSVNSNSNKVLSYINRYRINKKNGELVWFREGMRINEEQQTTLNHFYFLGERLLKVESYKWNENKVINEEYYYTEFEDSFNNIPDKVKEKFFLQSIEALTYFKINFK